METQLSHSGQEHLMIFAVAGAARHDAALLFQFFERLIEGQQGVGGRREAELAVFLKPLELAEQVEAQTAGKTTTGREDIPAAQDETEAGHAFEALVGG